MCKKDITLDDLKAYSTHQILERLRIRYRPGTRVRLVEMDDLQAPPVGTLGTVEFVDDALNIHIAWDNGSHLSAIYGVDRIAKDIAF